MNERINESLSALMDGEADELEIRRLLNQTQQSPELLEAWQRYQLIGSLMRKEPAFTVDLSKGIRQALDGEPMDEVVVPHAVKAAGSWRWLAASGAVAASVMLAVLVGVQQWQTTQMPAQEHGLVASSSEAPVAPADQQVAEPLMLASSVELNAEQQQQLEAAQRKLQEYVLKHNEQALDSNAPTLLPFMQTVKFNQAVESR